MKTKNSEHGISYIEMLMGIVIIGIASSIFVATLTGFVRGHLKIEKQTRAEQVTMGLLERILSQKWDQKSPFDEKEGSFISNLAEATPADQLGKEGDEKTNFTENDIDDFNDNDYVEGPFKTHVTVKYVVPDLDGHPFVDSNVTTNFKEIIVLTQWRKNPADLTEVPEQKELRAVAVNGR